MDINSLIKKLEEIRDTEAPQGGLTEVIIFVNDFTPLRIEDVDMDKSNESLAVECNGAYCAIDTGSW